MRVLLIGAGGVGSAIVKIAASRNFFEQFIVADFDISRAESAIRWVLAKHGAASASRFVADQIDVSSKSVIAAIIHKHRASHVLNAVQASFLPHIFDGCFEAGADYLDMGMSLSRPSKEDPFNTPGVKLGDDQFADHEKWQAAGRLALVGMGVEPGLSNVFARYAVDNLFGEVDEVKTIDGSNLIVRDSSGEPICVPSFSIWTTIEECLNPPVIWEKSKGWYTTKPFSDPEIFEFPEGIGAVECVNVEHEEVSMMPRWLPVKRVTFKFGLGNEFINILKTLHHLKLDSTLPVRVQSDKGAVNVSPRDIIVATLPDPATIGSQMVGKTCAGVLVTGKDKEGKERATYIYQVADNDWTMQNFDSQCVVWQTAFNPLIALELLATGAWRGAGVLGPECFDAGPFLQLMEHGYRVPWGQQDREPRNPLALPKRSKL
jgi:saccharopine dehydrogenase-like NADP-dependent oxidoreductase